MKSHLGRAACLAATVLASACTTYGPPAVRAGDSGDPLQMGMGSPTGRHVLPQGGTRYEFARGPFGKHTYMVDVDAQGRVLGWTQALTEANFGAVMTGTAEVEVLRRLGRPSDVRSGGRQGGYVWSYRYDATFCQWFQVSVVDHIVQSAAYAPDPLCDSGDQRLGSL